MNKTFNVISHTHWDREWYFPFEKFRMRLVDLFDNLLEVLMEYPDYIFHLDAQTIVLEDYLEIRPYKKDVLKRYITEGRLLVGPWYVQNDFYLTSGEATIRNLMIGTKIANDFGKCATVGYAPDQFGSISQMPQIMRGFGIDNYVFGRGYEFWDIENEEPKRRNKSTEFIWEGPDGSKVLGISLRFWYNNAQRFSENTDKSLELIDAIEEGFIGQATTTELLLMNGVDHLEAQENLLPIIDRMNERLPESKKVIQTSMEDYINKLQKFYDQNPKVRENLDTYQGELRNGSIYNLLQNTFSSRIYLKILNVKAQSLLENYLEPIYSFIEMAGIKKRYPQDYMVYLWKELIKNHPHDSICGCSHDFVHNNMEDRFNRIEVAQTELLERGLSFFTEHIDRKELNYDDNLICVFNSLQNTRNEVVDVEISFLAEEKVTCFIINDPSGADVPFEVLGTKHTNKNIYSPINLPGVKAVDTFQVQFLAQEVPGLGYKTYTVKKASGTFRPVNYTMKLNSSAHLENEYISVTITDQGCINLYEKKAGKVYNDILNIYDEGDVGDAYRHVKPKKDRVYSTKDIVPLISLIRDTEFEKSYMLRYKLQLPVSFDFIKDRRSTRMVTNELNVIISLKKSNKWLNIDFEIDNKAIDHRLRAIYKTGFKADLSFAPTAFDIIAHNRTKVLDKISNGDRANSGFVCIDDKGQGMAVLNKGIYEYEHLNDQDGSIALTLIRATGYISRAYGRINEISPDMIAEGNNCIRKVKLQTGIYPYEGDHLSEKVLQASNTFLCPLLPYFQPVDLKKFVGGRPTVQGSCISEIFYREDNYNRYIFSQEVSFLKIHGENIILSALKKAELGKGLILRVYNSGDSVSDFAFSCNRDFLYIKKVDLNEEELEALSFEDNKLNKVRLKPKEIFTLKFVTE